MSHLIFSRSHFQLTNHSQTLLVSVSLFYVDMIKFQVFYGGGGGGWSACLIFLVVKLLTGFEAFVPPVKDFTLDGASIVQMLKVVGVSIAQ